MGNNNKPTSQGKNSHAAKRSGTNTGPKPQAFTPPPQNDIYVTKGINSKKPFTASKTSSPKKK